MITKPCPDCGVEIPQQARRHKCGWTSHVNDKPAADPESWRCVHEDRGQRCGNPGVVSPSVKHKAAPNWYCWQHVPAMERMIEGVRVPPPMGFAALRALVSRPVKPYDFEAEAERIALQHEPVTQ